MSRQPAKPRRTPAFSARVAVGVAALVGLMMSGTLARGQGIALRGVGPVNSGMGGAGVGAPIDSIGAVHWNPASISGLPGSDMSFALELVLPTSTLSSSYGTSGETWSEPGVAPVPTMAMVRRSEGSPWSFGLGLFGIGGSRVNYAADPTNPVLMPQPSGLGRLSAYVSVMQIDPTISYEINENLSIGFAPTITMAELCASPLFLGAQNSDFTYSPGVGTRYAWGGGFQVGMFYTTQVGWHFGASLKSPQWMEPFRFKSEDQNGLPRDITYDLDYPLVASVGGSYTGFENWVLACDVRFFNYAGTAGFGDRGYDPTTYALTGLNWRDIYSVALGVQRRISDKLFVRGGYAYNDNPIGPSASMFNVASPLITQHTLHLGASYMFEDNWLFSLAYAHGFENAVTGPIVHPQLGPLPGSAVTSTVSADTLSAGLSKRF